MNYKYFGRAPALVATLLAVPSSGFTLPSATQTQTHTQTQRVGSVRVNVASLDIQDDATQSTTSPTYTADDAFVLDLFEEITPEDVLKDTTIAKTEPSSEQQQQQEVSMTDIIRDLDGNPLSKEYFAEKMGIPIPQVESYHCPGEDAFRGLMSNACRVRLQPGGQTAFYKHIVFATLGHAQEKLNKAPHKLVRDSQSYQVVANFLSSKACDSMTHDTGVQIPRLLDAQLEPNNDHPMESKFAFLFEDFAPEDGWYQEWLLDDVASCEVALSTFAKIHAYFWNGSDFWKDSRSSSSSNHHTAADELEEGVWSSGSYVQPKAQGADQRTQVSSE